MYMSYITESGKKMKWNIYIYWVGVVINSELVSITGKMVVAEKNPKHSEQNCGILCM